MNPVFFKDEWAYNNIADIALRNYLLGFRNRDSSHAIENVAYFELLRRGYDVAIGKIDNMEVDFIATTAGRAEIYSGDGIHEP